MGIGTHAVAHFSAAGRSVTRPFTQDETKTAKPVNPFIKKERGT
jgi:hypothetical protein